MALLSLAAVAALASAAPLSAPPNTTPYNLSSRPMISGTVVTVNDREMVVDTDQGQQITLELDTHTSAPRDLAPGMIMRAEFRALENCRLYATRVMPMRGNLPVAAFERQQAYANTRDEATEQYASTGDGMHERNAFSSAEYRREHGYVPANARPRVTEPQPIGEHSPGGVMTATPATTAYEQSTRPMITGSVVSVNDHHMVVATDQGQKVGVTMDSYTMIPADVAPGSIVRIDFKRMRDGRYYAKGIHRITEGMLNREQAYAYTRDSEFLVAQNVDDCWSSAGGGSATATSASADHTTGYDATTAENRPTDANGNAAVDENGQTVTDENATNDAYAQANPDGNAPANGENPESLPRTASNRPMILLFGALALGAAAMLIIRRRFFTA
ncbi:MAG TPA: hypothetical protein VJY35_13440 [Candidatus Eisenbacteria bacterium]|nr:hypothetical protein [Candidatus Eisenbacteria bacterium]